MPAGGDASSVTLYYSSIDSSVSLNSEGLIANGNFGLEWNEESGDSVSGVSAVKNQYDNILAGNVNGTITLINEKIYQDNTGEADQTYNFYYDLNTGANMQPPTVSDSGTNTNYQATFDVSYSSQEDDYTKNKYVLLQDLGAGSGWSNKMSAVIDIHTQAVIDSTNKIKTKLNFKKTKAPAFKKTSIFPEDEETAQATISTTTAATSTTAVTGY
jgi:hypothetical protein